MVENPMVIDALWKHIEEPAGHENMVQQPEHAGIDVFDCEILEGDEIVIDQDNGEVILKTNLERYLQEHCRFHFTKAE